jgi:CBS domain-containing protein
MRQYKVIDIFTNEQAWWQGRPLTDAILERIRDMKIAARTMIVKGSQGSYETGEVAGMEKIEPVSYNMPVRITIVIPAAELARVSSAIEEMVDDGIIGVHDVDLIIHKTRGVLLPRHIRVRDIMTRAPQKVGLSTPLDEVARLFLASSFTGMPVVDEQNRPLGVIAQSDLIYKANMPLRIGLLARSDQEKTACVLKALASKRAGDIMTKPAVSVGQDKLVADAVKIMVEKKVKRLPVVDDAGKLVGNISRLDVFSTVVCVVERDGRFLGLISDVDLFSAFSGIPGIWDFATRGSLSQPGRQDNVLKKHLRSKTASQIMNTDIVTVKEDEPIDEVMRIMLERAIKRIPVLDGEGKFKGIINRDSLLREIF